MPLGIISWQNSSVSSLSERSAPLLNGCLSLQTCKLQCPPATFIALPSVQFFLTTYFECQNSSLNYVRILKLCSIHRATGQKPTEEDIFLCFYSVTVTYACMTMLHHFSCILVLLFDLEMYKKKRIRLHKGSVYNGQRCKCRLFTTRIFILSPRRGHKS